MDHGDESRGIFRRLHMERHDVRSGVQYIPCDLFGSVSHQMHVQRDPADLRAQAGFVRLGRRFALGLDLVVQPVHQVMHGNLARADAGSLAGCGAGQARVVFRQGKRRVLLIPEPDAAKQP